MDGGWARLAGRWHRVPGADAAPGGEAVAQARRGSLNGGAKPEQGEAGAERLLAVG